MPSLPSCTCPHILAYPHITSCKYRTYIPLHTYTGTPSYTPLHTLAHPHMHILAYPHIPSLTYRRLPSLAYCRRPTHSLAYPRIPSHTLAYPRINALTYPRIALHTMIHILTVLGTVKPCQCPVNALSPSMFHCLWRMCVLPPSSGLCSVSTAWLLHLPCAASWL